jgi:hypothetical protein
MAKRRKREPSTERKMSHLVQFAAEIRAGRAVLGWSELSVVRELPSLL